MSDECQPPPDEIQSKLLRSNKFEVKLALKMCVKLKSFEVSNPGQKSSALVYGMAKKVKMNWSIVVSWKANTAQTRFAFSHTGLRPCPTLSNGSFPDFVPAEFTKVESNSKRNFHSLGFQLRSIVLHIFAFVNAHLPLAPR